MTKKSKGSALSPRMKKAGESMRKHYDFSKGKRNVHAQRLKQRRWYKAIFKNLKKTDPEAIRLLKGKPKEPVKQPGHKTIRCAYSNDWTIDIPAKGSYGPRKVVVNKGDDGYAISFFAWEGRAEIRTRIGLTPESATALVKLLGMHGVTWDQTKPIAMTLDLPKLDIIKKVWAKKAKPKKKRKKSTNRR